MARAPEFHVTIWPESLMTTIASFASSITDSRRRLRCFARARPTSRGKPAIAEPTRPTVVISEVRNSRTSEVSSDAADVLTLYVASLGLVAECTVDLAPRRGNSYVTFDAVGPGAE